MSKTLEMVTDGDGLSVNSTDNTRVALCEPDHDRAFGLKPNRRYAVTVVEIPEGYRLATEEDKKQKQQPRTKYLSDDHLHCSRWKDVSWLSDYGRNNIYAVPITPQPTVKVTIEVNGKQVNPSTLSAETWARIREGGAA